MTKRRATKEVLVGSVGVGGNNPIRIQSMTTSNTRDVESTVNQIIRLADVGCEIVRLTVQGINEAKCCEQIKNRLLQQGYSTPLVADIHFFPPAAMQVIEFVDKVRINPGNYADKRASFKVLEYDDLSYDLELAKIEEKFTPLVQKCKTLKKAMRIGTNHGSLSDRIMNCYGDTPKGMVESALEFARICRKNDYHDFIFSMKASNPQVMITSYRLLVAEMDRLGWNYPLHLGVTEAGQGEDGRIKSAMGIGSLLLDGIGDTIRVSLTEDPWYEIDPCKRLISFTSSNLTVTPSPAKEDRRFITYSKSLSLHRDGTVVVSTLPSELEKEDVYEQFGFGNELGKLKLKRTTLDCLILEDKTSAKKALEVIQKLQEAGVTVFSFYPDQAGTTPILSLKNAYIEHTNRNKSPLALAPSHPLAICIEDEPSSAWEIVKIVQPDLIFLSPKKERFDYARRFFSWLKQEKISTPLILAFSYACCKEDLIMHAAAECGSLLCDKIGEGIWVRAPYEASFLRTFSFNLLQAARMRSSKTEFISCPSCGRTLFDLQEVSKRIEEKTAHLPGVKIAIMGCIVNGPGEMADADFGYVGSKPGMIDLYVGKECVEKNISFADADDRLIALIKKHGRWIDKELN